jgi:hypothetical protein
VIRPTTPQCGTGTTSLNIGGFTENFEPSIVIDPVGACVTIDVSGGMSSSSPVAASLASASASIASLSRGEFRSANPIAR